MITQKERDDKRFWDKVDKSGGPDACWPYTGACHKKTGYGAFSVGRKNWLAHRYAKSSETGEQYPPSVKIMHSCDYQPCCNPAHLSPGTTAQNNADAKKRGRSARGMRNASVKLTDENVAMVMSYRGILTQRAVAVLFGVSQGLISHYWTKKYVREL